ncbi:MAG: dihydroorotate dehydrogenase electron transfer subunit [Nitrospirota bacterium]|nr:dihydroorotate dehydrogenase electron transfer subunit [Nitrospirota bacterium]
MGRLFKASVKDNREIAANHYLITLHPLEKIKRPAPGNFFMVSAGNGRDPLLKRPISVHRIQGSSFQLLYRVAGKGTAILSRKRTGDTIEILGPLGNGFPAAKTRNIILVAGGIGIAPVFALAESVAKKKPLLFYGARTKAEALCIKELASIGIKTVVSTDDGTLGEKGNVIDSLKDHLSRHPASITDHVLYACGPAPMLKALSEFAVSNRIKGHIALEQNMACGLGTCLGCVVNTVNGYKRVCKEGPVFPVEEIVW